MHTFCGLRRDGTGDPCPIPATSILACHSTSSWALVNRLTDNANLRIDKADSNGQCPYMMELLNLREQSVRLEQNYGFARPAPTSSMTLNHPTPSTGSEETESSSTT